MTNADTLLDTLLQVSHDGVLFIDMHGCIVKSNQKAAILFEQDELSLLDRVIWELPSQQQERQSLQQLFQHIITDQPEPRPYYIYIHTGDNHKITVCMTWNYIFDIDKKAQGIVCILHDALDSNKVNTGHLGPTIIEQVQYSRLATVEEVVARIAHELNQPLSAIMNFGSGTLRRLEMDYPNSDIMQSMKMILRQAKRASEVIDRMKGFLKNGELRRESLDINNIIDEVVNCMRPELAAAKVYVELQLESLLPAVIIDKVQIEQVLLNLIQNALESMRNTDISKRRIIIKTFLNNMQQVGISIADNGHGITSEIIKTIFDAFFTTKTTGMGIGLAISQSIVKAHGGKIIVESTQGQGATFKVLLGDSE